MLSQPVTIPVTVTWPDACLGAYYYCRQAEPEAGSMLSQQTATAVFRTEN